MAARKTEPARSAGAEPLPPPLIGPLIRDVHLAFRAAVDRALRPHALSLPQLAILVSLKRSPGLSNADLARGAYMTPQSMVELLAGLESAGLVVRHPHPRGGRALQAKLTPAGNAALLAARATIAHTESALLAGLTTPERRQLHRLLERALTALRQ